MTIRVAPRSPTELGAAPLALHRHEGRQLTVGRLSRFVAPLRMLEWSPGGVLAAIPPLSALLHGAAVLQPTS